MALVYLNRYESKSFQENFYKFLCKGVKLTTKGYAKFLVDNCNAADVSQEKPKMQGGGDGRAYSYPLPGRTQVNTCMMLLCKPHFEHLSLFLTSIFRFYITSLSVMTSTVNYKFCRFKSTCVKTANTVGMLINSGSEKSTLCKNSIL